MTTLVEETAEAVCAGLHSTEFVFIGESGRAPGQTTWFTRGRKPHIIRVAVLRSRLANYVHVNVEGYNRHTGEKFEQLLQIRCDNRPSAQEASVKAVERCLEIYRDVLEGTGIAGPKVKDDPIVLT